MQVNELEEVSCIQNVKCGGDTTSKLKVADGGTWKSLSLDGGIVTATHKSGSKTLIPLTNVAYLVPKAAKEQQAPAKK